MEEKLYDEVKYIVFLMRMGELWYQNRGTLTPPKAAKADWGTQAACPSPFPQAKSGRPHPPRGPRSQALWVPVHMG